MTEKQTEDSEEVESTVTDSVEVGSTHGDVTINIEKVFVNCEHCDGIECILSNLEDIDEIMDALEDSMGDDDGR